MILNHFGDFMILILNHLLNGDFDFYFKSLFLTWFWFYVFFDVTIIFINE